MAMENILSIEMGLDLSCQHSSAYVIRLGFWGNGDSSI